MKYTKKYVTTDEAYKELDDTEFYTIKQIDDFIEDERFAERMSVFGAIYKFRQRHCPFHGYAIEKEKEGV